MKYLTFTLFLFYNLNNFSQDVLNISLNEKIKLIYEEKYQFRLKSDKWNINNYLYTLNEQAINIDTLKFKNLIKKSQEFIGGKWKKNDFEKAYLFKKGEKVKLKDVLSELKIVEKTERKSLRKLIRKYNTNPTKWRGIPILITKPIFSDNNQYCIIGFRFGNNGGYTELYEKVNLKWKRIGIFDRFAF